MIRTSPLFIVFAMICLVLISPAMAQENPYRSSGEITALSIPVTIGSDSVTMSDSSGVQFTGAGYTHTIGRVSITMKPLLSKTGGTATVKGNIRRYGTDTIIEYELYRNLIKERITLKSPETIRYSYDIRISDWVTTEPDESRPKETAGQNSTVVTTYPYTKKITNYAKDSTSDIALDPWGNLVVYVNGEDIVVIPKPFAIDTTGKRFEMDFSLDKDARIITINGDLSGALYPVVVDPTEILTNGGFETGDLEGWNSNYDFIISPYITSSGCHTGTYCAQFYSAAYGEYYGSLVHPVSITPGNLVSMSVAAVSMDIHHSGGAISQLPGRKISGDTGNWIANGVAQNTGWFSGSQVVSSSYSYMWGAAYTHAMKMDSCSVLQYSPPVANFTGTPLAGTAPLMVRFNDTSTNDPISWSWNFGDGVTSDEQNPVHEYTSPGMYSVNHSASNYGGPGWKNITAYITVTNPKPLASFTATPLTGPAPLTVTFRDTSTNSPTSWSWLFGDGTTSASRNVSHRYTNPGIYTVNHSAKNAYGTGWSNLTAYINVTAPLPVVDFNGTPTTGTVPLTVTFTETSTNSPTSWSWIFGDGATSTDRNVSHTYTKAGNYTVRHSATNVIGTKWINRSAYVKVTNLLSVVDFTASPTSGTKPLTVLFTDTSTNTPTNFFWLFGDGTNSTSRNPSHRYTKAGTYTVSHSAKNSIGTVWNNKTDLITVSGGPVANFTGTPLSGTAPLAVRFTDRSTNTPTSWLWNFGDGGTATTKNPSHTYTSAGTYTVSLKAANAGGNDTMVKAGYVGVTGPVSNQATNIGGRNVSEIPLPYSIIEDAATVQRGLGYTAETKYYNQTNTMRSYIKNRLPNDGIFFFNGHGSDEGGSIQVDEDSNETYYANAAYQDYNFNDIPSFSSMRLAIFLGCNTGLTSSVKGNLVDVIVNKEGKCVMGWKKNLDSILSSVYGETFWNQMAGGQTTPSYAHGKAKDAVKNYQLCVNWHHDNPEKYTEYCNYDELYSGGPDCNTNLGPVNSKLVVRSSSLQTAGNTARNNIGLSEQSLIQKRTVIHPFTQKPDLNLTFTGISQLSHPDLYEFESDESSSFSVNNATGRVQSALWNEAGSKSQNEDFTIEQGSAIAEAFAKEKYPELWNLSDTRGIKLARNEVLDRGMDRQFCFRWEGILYGPSSTSGQRIEILDGNEVSVTVSPYTGHIIDYNEIYYPSVFAQTALVNLTPVVSEDQAARNALIEFRSLGISVNQSGDLQSLGLRTIVDKGNVPHLTWAFEVDQIEKWGTEEAYVNVDVQDGQIVWSRSFGGYVKT